MTMRSTGAKFQGRVSVMQMIVFKNVGFNVPVNNFSVMSGRSHRLLGFNQYSRESMCLAQGHNTATLVGTTDLSIRSPTLYVASIFILHVLLQLVIKKTITIYMFLFRFTSLSRLPYSF